MGFIKNVCVVTAVAVMMAVSVSGADPVGVKGGGVMFNGTKRLPPDVWISADFGAYNQTDSSHEMKFKVTPMKQDNFAVYEYITQLPGNSKTKFTVPISGGATDKYALDLILDGHRSKGSVSREHLAVVASKHHHMITIMNDDDGLVTGKLAEDIPIFHNRYLTSFQDIRSYPRHWVSFDSIDTVLIQNPEFESMTTRQSNAVKDYVSRGGTIVFNNPTGIMNVVGTPLEELLPIRPLHIRTIEVLDAVKDLGGSRIQYKEGFDFLDSLPIEPGFTTMTHDGFPLVRWRRYGLGYVGVCTVDPSGPVFLSPASGGRRNYYLMYRHLLSCGDRALIVSSSRDISLSSSVDKLTGVKIPSSGTIRTMVIVYLIAFFALIIAGAKLRKHVLAWGALTVFAIVMILGIYIGAAVMRSSLPSKTATILSFETRGETMSVTENMCGLLVKGEVQMSLENDSSDVLLRPMPSPWTKKSIEKARFHRSTNLSSGKGKKGPKKEAGEEVLTDPLRITYVEGRPSMLDMTLRDGKPRFFNTALPSTETSPLTLPELVVADGAFSIAAWKAPIETIDEAALILEDGHLRLKVSGDTLSLSTPYSTKEVRDPVVRHLLDYLGRAGRGVPMIAIFSPVTGDVSGLIGEEFAPMGRKITLIPVRETLAGGAVSLPSQRIRITGAYTNPQSSRIDGYWVEGDSKVSSAPLKLGARLPVGYRTLDPSRLEFDMTTENRGGNVNFAVFLLPHGDMSKKIEIPRTANGRYIFDFAKGPGAAKQAINRSDGTVQLAVQLSAKTQIRDAVAKLKMNSWKIKNMSISVQGEMPNNQKGSL